MAGPVAIGDGVIATLSEPLYVGGPQVSIYVESGGTMISSAYRLAAEIIERDYPSAMWNIYPFHFSDGDNLFGFGGRRCFEPSF